MIRFGDFLRRLLPWWVRYYNRLEIHGMKNLPKSGSAIIAPNHSGGWDLDNVVLMSLFDQFKSDNPARKRIWLCYWDKWAVEEKPWADWVQKFSPIPINLQGGGIPYKMVDKLVERGELIAIMPEGHSASVQEGYRLWRFYPGVIKLHLRYKIPIIPTACIGFVKACPILGQNYNPDAVPPWENEKILPFIFPKKLIIYFGKPIFFGDYFDKDPSQISKVKMYKLADMIRLKVKDQIKNIINHL